METERTDWEKLVELVNKISARGVLEDYHIVLHHNNIEIKSKLCFMCGNHFQEDASQTDDLKKTKHHAIPAALKPRYNVFVPICNECHRKVNRHNKHPNIKAKEGE